MSQVTTGWGVWLQTVEITYVKILSSSLFANLPTTFREDNNKEATLLKLDVDTEIEKKKNDYALVQAKRDSEKRLADRKRKCDLEYKNLVAKVKEEKGKSDIAKNEIKIKNAEAIFAEQENTKRKKNVSKNDTQRQKDDVQKQLVLLKEERAALVQREKFSTDQEKTRLECVRVEKKQERELLKAQLDQAKEALKDPKFLH